MGRWSGLAHAQGAKRHERDMKRSVRGETIEAVVAPDEAVATVGKAAILHVNRQLVDACGLRHTESVGWPIQRRAAARADVRNVKVAGVSLDGVDHRRRGRGSCMALSLRMDIGDSPSHQNPREMTRRKRQAAAVCRPRGVPPKHSDARMAGRGHRHESQAAAITLCSMLLVHSDRGEPLLVHARHTVQR